MAIITLTERFGDLDDWPGRLFEGDGSTAVTARTATAFSVRHGADSPFEGFRVIVAGTGFTYLDGVPTGGTMTSVRVVDAQGRAVVTIGGLGGNPVASDLSQFAANLLGGQNDEGSGPDGGSAWSHLLSGNDVFNGTAGEDEQRPPGFNAGNDTHNMGAGDDYVTGGIGNDTYNGGDGDDRLSFSETTFNWGAPAVRGATINRDTGVVLDPWGGTDRITGIEEFEGSRFNDVFDGSSTEEDEFSGLRGRDVIDGGDATFRNGQVTDDDSDQVSYRDDHWQGGRFGIVADLETSFNAQLGIINGTIRDGFGNVDTVEDIEQVVGTRYADSFIGSRVDNRFRGGEGRDTYDGAGGDDQIDFDNWFAGTDPGGVRVDLARATGQILDDGFGNVETARSIESIEGTNANDVIAGNAAENEFAGGDGADVLTGRGGSDLFVWFEDTFGDGDRITDFTATGPQADRLGFDTRSFEGMTTTLRLVNGANATTNQGTFLFINATDQLIWDSNGTGAGGREVVAVLTGVTALNAGNFDLWD